MSSVLGALWWAKGRLPEPDDDEDGRLPRIVAYPLIVMLSLAIYGGVIALCYVAWP